MKLQYILLVFIINSQLYAPPKTDPAAGAASAAREAAFIAPGAAAAVVAAAELNQASKASSMPNIFSYNAQSC